MKAAATSRKGNDGQNRMFIGNGRLRNVLLQLIPDQCWNPCIPTVVSFGMPDMCRIVRI